jgi:protoporphyrinogen oxidase
VPVRGSPPFVILGGGPCGLAAAWHLARGGHKPIVLEREPLVGGLCATHARNGWRFDLGGHRFVSSDQELTQWIERMLGDDLLTQERRSVVLHDGRRFRYPLEAGDLLRSLGPEESARALAGYGAACLRRRFQPHDDLTFEDWVTARFGASLYKTFFGPYTEKLWGLSPRAISADWAAERISLLSLGDAALRLAGLRRSPIRTYARRYRYPRYGMGQLYESIAREVERNGGEVLTSARVVGLERRGTRVVAVNVDTASGPRQIPVGELLSTIALPELVQALEPCRTPAVDRTVRALRFRALTFLNLMLGRPHFSENTWMYVASGALKMSRIQEPKRRSSAMAPPGRTSIMLEIPCDVGDRIWNAPVGALRSEFLGELRVLGFDVDDVLDAFAVRVEHGYPVYHMGYDRDRMDLLRIVERFENVRTAGRQGLFRYVFMDAAMSMGVHAAEEMLAGTRSIQAMDAIGRARGVIEAQALTA